ncbi:MAG TPA: bifunctional riboflavin kinase/FAD synthetase [Candidatus Binataceae bacterium]|nr:bifunctional riboflavin kinase/FAD synthetase [Candidatus Binataceae bacterium]
MEVIRELSLPPGLARPVLALGNFDGVHRGHRAILETARECAQQSGVCAVAMTFEPTPAKVLAPARAPKLLMTLADKLACMAETALDAIIIAPFTRELSLLSPEQFARQCLMERLHISCVVVGHSISFGHARGGNAAVMKRLGEKLGFEVRVVEALSVDGVEVSSTRIRRAVERGDMGEAARMLGRYHFLSGIVIRGRQRGHQLGFPTANLRSLTETVPPDGVYATRLVLPEGAYASVTNIGLNPTFDETQRSVETHIFDFSGDLYDRQVKVEFIERLRGERKFDSGQALAHQIASDVQRARAILDTVG